MDTAFAEDLEARRTRIGIVGLGYVGLPLAVAFAAAGFRVIGVDVVADRVARLSRCESYLLDVASAELATHVSAGRLVATMDADLLAEADVIFVCVPTPFDRAKAPDLSYIEAAAETIARILRRGQLILLESTTYPGTTEEILIPALERSGLRAGRDFYVAFSPERIDPGNREFTIANTPKVVGGIDAESAERAKAVLSQVVRDGGVHVVSTPRAAELTKLLENTFRAVNIALVNELAMLCDRMNIDVWEVIEAARTKPYGFMAFQPGPGVGGHCLPTGETVLVRDATGAGPRTVDDLWRAAASRMAVALLDGSDVVEHPGLAVLGVGVDGPPQWESITQLFRRRFDGELVTLRTVDGRELVVTDRHPLLVATPTGVQVRQAREVTPGDLLPIIEGIAGPDDRDPTVDVIAAIPATLVSKVRAAVRDGSWAPLRSVLRVYFGAARAHDWIRREQVPLQAYLDLAVAGVAVPPRAQLVLRTGRGPGRSSLSAVVRITPDIARLIGYYATEGCITTDSSRRVRFTFHAEETEVLADLQATLASMGQRWSISRDRSCANVHVKVSSQLFAVLLREALGCGTSSYDSAVPELVLGAGRRHRLALFSGLLRGDGSVDARIGARPYVRNDRPASAQNNSASVGFWTTSVHLERQFSFLAQSLGFRTSIQRRRTQTGADFHILGVDVQPLLASLLADVKRDRLVECLASKCRSPRSRGIRSMAGQAVTTVAEVTRRCTKTTVYSIETARTHTFATGPGIFVHNCIPVDPYYLSWKAREFDFSTKFIEIAAETNLDMPFFTVEKLRRVLRQRGRTLAGAEILVVGAAFKRDIDDARNSAAIRVIEILCAEGAHVRYHDPYVPEITIGHGLYGSDAGHTALRSVPLDDEILASAHAVVILVAHGCIDYGRVVRNARFVFDAVNATRDLGANPRVVKL